LSNASEPRAEKRYEHGLMSVKMRNG